MPDDMRARQHGLALLRLVRLQQGPAHLIHQICDFMERTLQADLIGQFIDGITHPFRRVDLRLAQPWGLLRELDDCHWRVPSGQDGRECGGDGQD